MAQENTSDKQKKIELSFMTRQTIKAAAEFLLVAAVLTVIGWLAHCQINTLLNEAMEESVSRHVNTITHTVEQQFRHQFYEIHVGISLVENGQLAPKDLIGIAHSYDICDSAGIIARDGSTVVGEPLNAREFEELHDALDGENALIYHNDVGLMMAMPIELEGGNHCLYYERFPNESLTKMFGVLSYDGQGRVTLGYKSGEWHEISLGPDDGEFYNKLYKAPGFIEAYRAAIFEETLRDKRAVKQFEFDGENYFIFSSFLPNDDFAIFGIVKRDVVAIGIDYIHAVMLGVICMFLLILIMVGRYLIKSVENKELQREKSMADRSNKMKSEFLSNVSHELRTPLNAILGMDEMILRSTRDNSMIEYAENIRTAGNSLLGLVNDILDFSKIEAGKMEIIPVDYQLSSVLNDLVNMLHTRADKKGLQLIVNAAENLPTMLHGDEIRIKQVVTNILTNAVKYTEKGSVTLTVDFDKIADDRISLRISVKDTGIGIKPEDIPKLFKAFERIEEERNRTIEGTGLGMNITQRLLDMMGSKLEVESVYGEGSTFSFAVEQGVADWSPIGNFEEAFRHSLTQRKLYHEKFTAPTAKILVVDDTVMNLTVVKGLLKQTKIQVQTAESGFECLELVQREKYDIIFLDHRMPIMDGLATFQKMRELENNLNKDTPVIALTANAISGAREQYLAAGMSAYLSKPIDPTALETMIMQYLPAEKIESASAESTIEEETIDVPEWLSKVEGIDIKEGIKHCGSTEDYLNALTVFAESIKANADEIENYFRAEQWRDYTTKVHALKSTARVIGANELSERAKRLEDAGNSLYIDEIKTDTAPLLELYRTFAEKLSPLIKQDADDSDKPLISDDELADALETLKEMAASFDYDNVTDVLNSLNEYRLPEDQIERFKSIREAAAKLDWEQLNKLLNAA